MSVLLETLSGLKRKLQITVPADEMAKTYQQSLQKQAKTANIKGFRQGKVPTNVVERYYGKQLKAQVSEQAIDKSFREALDSEKLRLAGQPSLSELPEWSNGDDLVFEVEFEVYPEVGEISTDGVQATEYSVTVADEDVDKMINDLRKQHVSWEKVERAAEQGDKVTIDFAGSINDVAFDGGSAKDFEVTLGDGRMIAGFEDGLLGIEEGVSRELKLMFPEEYHAKDLAGQPVEFQVTAKKVEAPVEPALDDELAKKMGFDTLEDLKKAANEKMHEDAMSRVRAKQKQGLLDQLMDKHTFELPDVLMEGELSYLRSLAKQQAASRQESVAEEDLNSDEIREQAEKRVKLGILLSEIVRQHDIQLDQAAVQQKVRELAMGYPNPQELVEWLYKDRSRLMEIETSVLEDQAVSALMEKMDKETVVLEYANLSDFLKEDESDA